MGVLAVLIGLCLPAQPVRAADPVVIDAGFRSVVLAPALEIARDPSADWSPETAARAQFAPLEKTRMGYLQGAVWARFGLTNRDAIDRSLVLDISDKHFERVQLYAFERGGARPQALGEYGWALPYEQRAIKSRNIQFPVTVRAGQTVEIYISLKTPVQMLIDPVLYSELEFQQHVRRESVITYEFYGALMALMIYNLLLSFATRERASLSYVAFLCTWGLLIACWDGVIYQFWPYAWVAFDMRFLYLMAALAILSMTVFSIEYLQLRQQSRGLLYPQYVLLAVGVLFIPAALFLPLLVLRYLVSVIYLSMLLCNGITGFRLGRGGNRYARFYMAGFFAMLVLVMFTMREVFLIPGRYNDAELWARLAFLLPVGLFSVGLGQRINELKEVAAESRLRAAHAHAEAEFKSRFLVTMSHEIRTPLNGVVGMTELLRETPLSESQNRYVEVINSSGKALLEVINDVLDFAKLEHGKFNLEIIGFNLERLIDECIDVFALTKKSGSVVFNACIEPGTPLLLMGDPTRIKQVLINLVGNAFKFTQAGEVNLSIRLVPGENRHVAPALRFTVSDTGIGMDEAVQRQLFTAFTQADGSITRRYGGSGLGLAICKQLVELMGGSIGVDSQPGLGSRFWFSLPLVLAAEDAVIEPLARAPVLRAKRVLLVDDHDAFCHAMRVALESFHMQVDIAQTGTHARQRLRDSTYDVLIIDRRLPDVDGLDLAVEVYSQSPRSAPPILLVSVGVDIIDEARLRAAGVAAHLLKPIPLGALHDTLVRLFEPAPAVEPRAAVGEQRARAWRVLVAEDNGTNQVVIGSMLKRLGIDATFAADGQLAVDCYRRALDQDGQAFDLVFMDCEMPVLDGYAATRQIRQIEVHRSGGRRNDGHSAHIIGLTAHALPEYRDKALAAGMEDFLTKPVKLAELRRVLDRLERA